MRVAALFRFPVKGFAGQECASLDVLPGGRIAGDRVLGFRFTGSGAADDAWSTKLGFIVLMNTPGLARLRLHFDQGLQRLRIERDGEVLADDRLDDAGRARIAAAVERHVRDLDENPLASLDGPLAVRVIGDGVTPRYQDQEPGYVTLHGRSSVAAVAATIAERPEITEARFRSNIAIDGVDEWEEQRWIGRNLRVGDVEFEVVSAKTRCLATHANPLTGERDQPILKALLAVFPSERPTFAVAMRSDRGGVIRCGDTVELA